MMTFTRDGAEISRAPERLDKGHGEIPSAGQEHRNRTLRTKLRNQVTLREILLVNEKPHN
jgi:hypothetical protein